MKGAGRVMHLSDWPERDRLAWGARFVNIDVFDYDNPAASWSQQYRSLIAVSYGRWLAYLDKQGKLDSGATPFDRATPEAVAGFVEQLKTELRPLSLPRRFTAFEPC